METIFNNLRRTQDPAARLRTELFLLAQDGLGWAEVVLRLTVDGPAQLVELDARAAAALVGQVFLGYQVRAVEWGDGQGFFGDYEGYRAAWADMVGNGANEEVEDDIREAVLASLGIPPRG